MKEVKQLYCINPGAMYSKKLLNVTNVEEIVKIGLFSKQLIYKVEFTDRPPLIIPAKDAVFCVYEDGTQSIPYEKAQFI